MWKDKFEEQDAGDEVSFGRIPFQIWDVSKFSSCAGAAIVGLNATSLVRTAGDLLAHHSSIVVRYNCCINLIAMPLPSGFTIMSSMDTNT